MGRLNRAQRKEEEKRIIAEMEEALKENKKTEENAEDVGQVCDEVSKTGDETQGKTSFFDSTTPQKVHCKRCKTLMEKGVCPTCGFRIYVPMEQGKRDKIRLWVTVVCLAIFFCLFLISQMKNS